MKNRVLSIAIVLMGYVAFAQCNANAQYSWNVSNPVFGTNYYYMNIPYNAICTWSSGTAVARIDVECWNLTTNSKMMYNNSASYLNGTNFRQEYGSIWLSNLPMYGLPVRVKFIAKDAFGNQLDTYSVDITVRPYP